MKLVILTQYFYPEMGAPQNRLYELALGMRELGWDVEVITAMPNYPTGRIFDGYRGSIYRNELVSGIAVHRYTLYPSKSSSTIPRIISMLSFSFTSLFSIVTMGRGRTDYLMVESPPLPLAFTGWLLSKLSNSKLIMNVSDLWPLSAKELGAISDGTIYRLLTRLEAFLYRHSTVCTCQSQEIVDYISARKKQNVWLLRNGVDSARFAAEVGTERSNKIVYAGLLGIAQGILSIIENINFRELGMEFHIFGSGNEKEQIEKFLAAHPDRGAVYQGVLGRDDIPHTLARYDATLVALVKNIYGAVPSKIYEAMAAGLPILFSGVGEGARIVRENAVGWQNDPGDWKSLIHNLVRLKQTTNEELLEMKRQARRVASDKFDRRNQIANFHRLLSDLTT